VIDVPKGGIWDVSHCHWRRYQLGNGFVLGAANDLRLKFW